MTNSKKNNRYRFIPYRKHDIVEMCIQEKLLAGQEDNFRQLYYMLSSLFHFEFHQIVESLKDRYAATDPDADTLNFNNPRPLSPLNFVELLDNLLEKANYERITQSDLDAALNESSLFKIRLHVDFDDFADVLLFCRGISKRKETVTRFFGLLKKDISFINYDRVVLYIKFRDDYQQDKAAMPGCKPGVTMLKLFQNVPKADLEMLFPNTTVRMRTMDKLLIGVPAVVSGGIVLTTKLGASLVILGSLFGFWFGLSAEPVELNKTSLTVLLVGIATFSGYLWKQFSNFKNRKLRFMQTLTQNLYFKNLDNNAGVFHRLANDAEEEECKEAILAYYFLLTKGPMNSKQLDSAIEHWLQQQWHCQVDFEIDDALNKLQALSLITEENGQFSALELSPAIHVIDERWDNYYTPEKSSH